MIRSLAALLAGSLALTACGSPATPPPVPTTADEWLRQNAHPLSSIDVAERDFRDLEPLRRAIGDARVVMLGEQTHGDGATFLAKARLVAFLHREMDFDVLVWESGIYDVERVWAQIRAGTDVRTASRRGIFSIWSRSEQVLPTLDYVAGTLGTARPLEMAGMDAQLTTALVHDSLSIHVDRFAREIGSPVVDDPAWEDALRTLWMASRGFAYNDKPTDDERADLLRLLDELRGHAAGASGERARFWAHVLESVSVGVQIVWAWTPGADPTGVRLRERQMARNLIWLAEQHYRGRKLIVWAASAHIARDLHALHGRNDQALEWVPMGHDVHQALESQVYTIAFTAARGSWGMLGNHYPLQAPLPGSLEARLDALGTAYAFIDFRSPGPGGEWLRDMASRPMGYGYERGDWTRVFDGMVYTREMFPSTPVP